jgi:nucleotide-binding universal stress UspA family protein
VNETSPSPAFPDPTPAALTVASDVSRALPRRLLVGVDGGPASADALALARTLAAASGAELLVASVKPYWPDSVPSRDYARVAAEEEAKLRREVAPALGAQRFQARVIGGGRADDGLKEIAEAEGLDLIVIGSTDRGPVGRVLAGSVGERVLDGAPCAVAIAPRGSAARVPGPRQGLRRVVVGCDGSREASAALALAAALAEPAGAEITLVGVVEMHFDLAGFPRPADPKETARLERALARARDSLPAGLRVETKEVHGVAADVIAAVARDADLLALGSRGNYGRVRRLFLGSVAGRLASTAPCATVVVPTT